VADGLIWRSVVGIPVQRIRPVLGYEAIVFAKNVCALETQTVSWPDRDLRLHASGSSISEVAQVLAVPSVDW
jgi:hypothetical protein